MRMIAVDKTSLWTKCLIAAILWTHKENQACAVDGLNDQQVSSKF